jgi:hypothetical protein
MRKNSIFYPKIIIEYKKYFIKFFYYKIFQKLLTKLIKNHKLLINLQLESLKIYKKNCFKI